MEGNNKDDGKNKDYVLCNAASQHEGSDDEYDCMLIDTEKVDDLLTESVAFDAPLSKGNRHSHVLRSLEDASQNKTKKLPASPSLQRL